MKLSPMGASRMEATVLVDNVASGRGLQSEHGFSLWVEAGGLRILFDTGQGAALDENARRLGIPLHKADFVVLSHGHYDHTGGLAEVLKYAPSARPVIHPGALAARYSLRPPAPARAIGIPASARTALEPAESGAPAPAVTWSAQAVFLTPSVGVTGPIPRKTAFEDVGGPFFLDPQGKEKDPLVDDQALWVRTPGGVVACVGCSHAGIVNTLHHIMLLSGVPKIHAVIGGFHLLQASGERLEQTVRALQEISPDILAPCHCTGESAVHVLKQHFTKHVAPCEAGTRFQF